MYVVDILIGSGMKTLESEDLVSLSDDILELYDRHKDDFNLLRATEYWEDKSVVDVKLKILSIIKQRRKLD
jgi:predicted CopG family antitoxin